MPPKPIEEAPSLPPQSVDFTAMHDAIKAGKTADECLAAAGVAPVEIASEPVAEPAADTKE
jgi:hypothetical protein